MGQGSDVINQQVYLAIDPQVLVQDKTLLVFYNAETTLCFGSCGLEILLGYHDIEFFEQLDQLLIYLVLLHDYQTTRFAQDTMVTKKTNFS